MKAITKYRILNRWNIISVILGMAALIGGYLLLSNIWGVLRFNTNAPDLGTRGNQIRNAMLYDTVNLDNLMMDGINLYAIVIIFIAILPEVSFFNERKGLRKTLLIKTGSRKKNKFSVITLYSLISGLCTFLPYLIYLIIGVAFNNFSLDGHAGRPMFSDIFRFNLFNTNLVLFYLIFGIVYFLFGCTYGFLAFSVASKWDRKFMIIVIPSLVYYGFSILFTILIQVRWLSPIYTIGAVAYTNPTYYALLPLLIPIAFGIGIMLNTKDVDI